MKEINPLTTEFLVNTWIKDGQNNPTIAALNYTTAVIGWDSATQEGDTGSGDDYGIYAQIVGHSGNKILDPFHVNTYAEGYQRHPAVAAMQEEQRFAFVWQGSQPGGSSSTLHICGQLFDYNTNKIGQELVVDKGYGASIDVISESSKYVIVWSSSYHGSDYNDNVFLQLLDKDFVKIGSIIQVFDEDYQYSIANDVSSLLFNDRLIVVRQMMIQNPITGVERYGIQGQLFNNEGYKYGDVLELAWDPEKTLSDPKVSKLDNGGFVVVYDSSGSSPGSINGQIFDGEAQKIGDTIIFDDLRYCYSDAPTVTMINGTGFAVTYQATDEQYRDVLAPCFSTINDIFVQIYDNSGQKIGNETFVNYYTDSQQDKPVIAALDNYEFVVAWVSDGDQYDEVLERDDGGISARVMELVSKSASEILTVSAIVSLSVLLE